MENLYNPSVAAGRTEIAVLTRMDLQKNSYTFINIQREKKIIEMTSILSSIKEKKNSSSSSSSKTRSKSIGNLNRNMYIYSG